MATYPDLKDKVAFVTGIGQSGSLSTETWGNGAAIARLLCKNGARVFGCDLNLSAAQHTATRIRAEGGVCEVVAADVTSSSHVQKAVDAAIKKFGRIDILVNNVGMSAPGDPASMPEHVWDKQVDLNLKSVYLTCHAILPLMEKQGRGVVVNNASIAGLRYIGKSQVAYAATKAAVIQFTKVSAVIYARRGVRMNSVAPGLIYTPLVDNLKYSDSEADLKMYRDIVDANVPMGHMGDAFDVANASIFLMSDCAKYITGQTLVVDGGLTSSTGAS